MSKLRLGLLIYLKYRRAHAWCRAIGRICGPQARANTVHLEKSPLSGGVLIARAIRSSAVRLPAGMSAGNIRGTQLQTRRLYLPNVQASEGGQPVDHAIWIDPNNPKHILTAGNDYNCSSKSARLFCSSTNGGKKWTGNLRHVGSGCRQWRWRSNRRLGIEQCRVSRRH